MEYKFGLRFKQNKVNRPRSRLESERKKYLLTSLYGSAMFFFLAWFVFIPVRFAIVPPRLSLFRFGSILHCSGWFSSVLHSFGWFGSVCCWLCCLLCSCCWYRITVFDDYVFRFCEYYCDCEKLLKNVCVLEVLDEIFNCLWLWSKKWKKGKKESVCVFFLLRVAACVVLRMCVGFLFNDWTMLFIGTKLGLYWKSVGPKCPWAGHLYGPWTIMD